MKRMQHKGFDVRCTSLACGKGALGSYFGRGLKFKSPDVQPQNLRPTPQTAWLPAALRSILVAKALSGRRGLRWNDAPDDVGEPRELITVMV